MEKKYYPIEINAPIGHVFEAMLGLEDKVSYEKWTAAFNPTSTYEGNWVKGGKMYFVGTDEEGNRGGMISEIAEYRVPEFVSIRHYGILKGDEEITSGEDVEKWAGGFENYHFTSNNGRTKVTVELDVLEDFTSYFEETYPKALLILKAMIEDEFH
ncbi:MAG: SRPBCC domain-containing protein [Bacteroidota bacterium]